MSTALKTHVSSSPRSSQPPLMNKPIHSQGGTASYVQPQNAVGTTHVNPVTQANNMSQFSINKVNYECSPGAPPGRDVQVAQNQPTPISYSPQKLQLCSQPMLQQQHGSSNNVPVTAQHAQQSSQSNGTTVVAKPVSANNAIENHTPLPKKMETSTTNEKHALSNEMNSEKPLQPAEVPLVTDSVIGALPNSSLTASTNTTEAKSSKVTTVNSLPAKDLAPAQKEAEIVDKPAVTKVEDSNTAQGKKNENCLEVESENLTRKIVAPIEEGTPTKIRQDEASIEVQKSPIKVATPRTPSRKSKTPKSEPDLSSKVKVVAAIESKPSTSRSPGGGKAKRQRTRTQPYQSPLPELEILTKMMPHKSQPESKLIVFYKNEHLAVRNSEGGFFVCQAVQNVYKTSAKIKIRWLSQEKSSEKKEKLDTEIYTPDFYDTTDFDCILTNLNLIRVEKGKFKLPAKEKTRTDNILKRAIAVEKGEDISLDDSLTEDNPDGLDVSLFKKEEQLVVKNKRGAKKRRLSPRGNSTQQEEQSKSKKTTSPKKTKAVTVKTKTSVTSSIPGHNKKPVAETPRTSLGRAERAKRRNEGSRVIDAKKARVLAKVVKRASGNSKKNSIEKKPSLKEKKVMSQSQPSTSKERKENKNARKGKK